MGDKRITVLSTGIGTDNIDIVLNELDALVNIDFATRTLRKETKVLNIIRIGTSGAVQKDIPIGSIMVSEYALGLDSLMHYYEHKLSDDEQHLLKSVKSHFQHLKGISPYITASDPALLAKIGKGLVRGITLTAPGFYAPQGRFLRVKNSFPQLIRDISSFKDRDYRITNLEMETSGIYALSRVLGHKALSVNAILASRVSASFSHNPEKVISEAIQLVLSRL